MADQKMYKLIKSLYQKTQQGEVRWERTVTTEEFQASFMNYSVGISRRLNKRTGLTDMRLIIYDANGEEIDEAVDTDFDTNPLVPEAYNMMASIYEQARRVALGADTALDTLLAELSA